MKRRILVTSLALATLVSLGWHSPPGAWSAEVKQGAKARLYGDADRGRDIATKWCASCHAVQGGKVSDQVPTFAAIGASPKWQPDVLRAFLNAPHKPMPPLQLTNQEIEDLVAFIREPK